MGRRVVAVGTNLEAAGDEIAREVMGHLAKRLKRGLPMPQAERAEAKQLPARLAATARAAAVVFMTDGARDARLLVAEKEAFRELEATATAVHFTRLRAHTTQGTNPANNAMDGSAMHLDLPRDCKWLNSHLVAAAAYHVLVRHGRSLSSRLRADPQRIVRCRW